ncbi:hypothetical protein DOTSEDRAFT_69742 [Dothistroma septosporum NZE10]|uniref:Uncharacterized protein n=1 Tax=Dothistroma septosporum (strain NZE10 / CBS 128990) TaxID=675120 RepID=N1PY35_DOTSN|nr:hypothetical protein DOTSEDRAFT_69742 [Dothistroma septosporum NZE10]
MIYHGVFYAYTPEILPSAHRATGYGCCVILGRIGGIVGIVVGSHAAVHSTTPSCWPVRFTDRAEPGVVVPKSRQEECASRLERLEYCIPAPALWQVIDAQQCM